MIYFICDKKFVLRSYELPLIQIYAVNKLKSNTKFNILKLLKLLVKMW